MPKSSFVFFITLLISGVAFTPLEISRPNTPFLTGFTLTIKAAQASALEAQHKPSSHKTSGSCELFEIIKVDAGDTILTYVNQLTRFFGQAHSRDNEITRYEWDFDGDGNFDFSSPLPFASHLYQQKGIYNVVLRAYDQQGYADTDLVKVIVKEGKGRQRHLTREKIIWQKKRKAGMANCLTDYYVLMLNAGNEARYWEDVIRMYSTLKDVYGFKDERIYLLNDDGKNPFGENPDKMIDYPALPRNIEFVFQELADTMDKDDILFLWIDGHGYGYTGRDNSQGPAFYGYLDGFASVDPGDEEDYLERDFKLRSLFTGGDFRANHGLGVWKLRYKYDFQKKVYEFYRNQYLSRFENIKLQDSSVISDNDIFIERFVDYLLGDENKNGYLEPDLGEVADYDGDGIQPYNPQTGLFDEDDWGLIDVYEDNYNYLSTGVPRVSGGDNYYCLFDAGFDHRLDLDLNSKCRPWELASCDTRLLEVDATDLDNAGYFDGVDANDDGDMEDWISIDELVDLPDDSLSDDQLKAYLDLLDAKNVIVFMQPCFSGGFVEDLSNAKTLIMTATVEEDVSWGNVFVDNFRTALHNKNLADLNQDDRVSLVEAFNYAAAHDALPEIPQYDDNGDKISHPYPIPNGGDGDLGADLFLLKQELKFTPGDANSDSQVNLADAIFILNYLFANGPVPQCLDSANVNNDAQINIADAIYLLNYLFASGPAPKAPFPEAGVDPTDDDLSCGGRG